MERILDLIEGWSDLTPGERTEAVQSVRRFLLAAMESGNPTPARTVLRELAEVNAELAYSLRAELVSGYGIDIN